MRDYYNDIPVGRENAVSRDMLIELWNTSDRGVRRIIQDMRNEDNGDSYIIISLSQGSGYFRSDDPDAIRTYVNETQSRAASTLAPLRKAKRILKDRIQMDAVDTALVCKLQDYRTQAALTQDGLVKEVRKKCPTFDRVMLSKAENASAILTPDVLAEVARLLDCKPRDIYPSLLTGFQTVLEGC